ncbi:MAG: T9SS type A sorting domain-containing protein [Chitinophagaceae bacterium]
MKKNLLFLLLLFVACKLHSQSIANYDYGGNYYSNESGQFFANDIVQTSKISVDSKVTYKVGFLYSRLLFLLNNGQNNGTFSIIPIIVFPNPATVTINFFISNAHIVKQVFIYSSLGKLVKKAGNQNSINIAELPKGIYLLQIHLDNNQVSTAKFLKH